MRQASQVWAQLLRAGQHKKLLWLPRCSHCAALTNPSAAGVTFVQQTQLPELAMQFQDVSLTISDSSFDSLTSMSQAAVTFVASNVTFRNVSFTNNVNSAGA